MIKKRQIRWGIIGCGDVTEVKSGPALQKVSNSSLVAVMRRNGEKAKDYAERHGVSIWYTDAQKLIDDLLGRGRCYWGEFKMRQRIVICILSAH